MSIDVTHIEANTKKKTPERLMSHLARKIHQAFVKEHGSELVGLPEEPDYKEIEDHNEAKESYEKLHRYGNRTSRETELPRRKKDK